MQQFLIGVYTNHEYLVYALLVLVACAEGPIISLIMGVILRLGYFDVVPVLITLMLGDLIGDAVWYFIGRQFGHRFIRRFGKYFSITEESVNKVLHIFQKYKYKILMVSKVSNGFGFSLVTLMTAGMTRIPFLNFISINMAGQLIWSSMLLGVGYFFGNLYLQVDSVLGKLSVAAIFIVLFFAFLGYKKYLHNKAEAMEL